MIEKNIEKKEKDNATEQKVKFSDYNVSENIVKALKEMGYVHPTTVQKSTIEYALDKRDLIVLSKTGSGKTAAFGVPAVQLIHDEKVRRCLVLAPTRELAVQVETEISKIAKYHKVRTVVVYGKHSMNVEVEKMDKGFDIMVGTPGRVLDHMKQGTMDASLFNLVILDEADRMLDMGFIDQVDKIIGNTSKNRTTYLFSATIPEEIVRLSGKYLKDPATVELESDVKTVEQVEQYYYHVKRNEKRSRLYDILAERKPQSCIVFCNTRFEVDRVTDFLLSRGITAKSIHGANSQSLRIKFLNQFKKGAFRVLVATDVAARGLHIEDLELVINYNLPVEKDAYVHRIGRTGRAGKTGTALSMVSDGEFFQLYTIEEHAGAMIEEIPLPPKTAYDKKRRHEEDLYSISFKEVHAYNPENDNHGVYPPRHKRKNHGKKAKVKTVEQTVGNLTVQESNALQKPKKRRKKPRPKDVGKEAAVKTRVDNVKTGKEKKNPKRKSVGRYKEPRVHQKESDKASDRFSKQSVRSPEVNGSVDEKNKGKEGISSQKTSLPKDTAAPKKKRKGLLGKIKVILKGEKNA